MVNFILGLIKMPCDPHIGPSPAGLGQYEGQRANMRTNMKLTMHYYTPNIRYDNSAPDIFLAQAIMRVN